MACCNSLEKLTSRAEFNHEVDASLALVDLVQPNDVWVAQVAHHTDLVLDLLSAFGIHGEFVEDFDCPFVAISAHSSFFHLAEGALS